MATVKTSVVGASAAHQSTLASYLQTVKDNYFLTGLLNDRGIKTLTINIGTPGDNANGTTDILRQVNDPKITINKDVIIGPDGELHRAMKIAHNDGTTSIEAIKSIKSIITHEIVHALFPNLTAKITPKFTVHNTDDPLPENGVTTDLVGEIAFRRLTITLREKIYAQLTQTIKKFQPLMRDLTNFKSVTTAKRCYQVLAST